MENAHTPSAPTTEGRPPEYGSKTLMLPPDFEERDFIAEGYQELQIEHFLTCTNCRLNFSSPEPQDPAIATCPNCRIPAPVAVQPLTSGTGEEYFPFEPDKQRIYLYLPLWYGRMNRATFAILSLLTLGIAGLAVEGLFLIPFLLFVFVQMIKREHDLGRSWTHLLPLATIFVVWLVGLVMNLGLIGKFLFVLFAYALTLALGRLLTTPGTPGPNRFGPRPGLFRPFGGPAPATVAAAAAAPPAAEAPPAEETPVDEPPEEPAGTEESADQAPPEEK